MTKYYDTSSVINVLSNIYTNPSILEDERYHFNGDDFDNKFHKMIFGTIYNLYMLGAQEINLQIVEDYINSKPQTQALYKANKGIEYLQQLESVGQSSTFDYYYNRMKKFTLLRAYQKVGLDMSSLYDEDNITNLKKKEKQEQWLDNTTIEDIAQHIDDLIEDIKLRYVDNSDFSSQAIGDGLFNLLEELKKKPAYGYPMIGKYMNTITRGARFGTVYLKSAQQGLGKTTSMIAEACNFACNELYNLYEGKWETNYSREPTLYITTEQTIDEVQIIALAFIASVDREHILLSKYDDGELERVQHAARILAQSPLYIQQLPDFGLTDIENCIKREIRVHKVKFVCYDYIHSSLKLLSEIGSKSGVKGLREDNFLFMLIVKIKDIAVQYDVFILTGTQLNAEAKDAEILDQNCLRGRYRLCPNIPYPVN